MIDDEYNNGQLINQIDMHYRMAYNDTKYVCQNAI